ncbi:type-1 fimbrial protein [Klebsiella pneumoniae]|nr:type-1 fimbrial protein [Klebsiella pneumoniae]
MKKQLHALTLLAVICGAAVSTANAADGTINFNGEIIDAACTVSPASANQTVTLGQVSSSALATVNQRAAATSFQIDLTACPASVTTASVKFDGTPYQGDTSALALTPLTGAAIGVGIQIRTATGLVLPLYTASTATPLVQGATNTLRFDAAYVAKSVPVTAGPADAVATFSVIYN